MESILIIIFRRYRAILLTNPKPEDSNFLGHWLGKDVNIKIVGICQDENVTVLLTKITSPLPKFVRYPYIVIEAPEDKLSPYSSEGYPALLVERFMTQSLLEMKGEGDEEEIVPINDKWEGNLKTYYTYPETKAKLINLNNDNIEVHGVLCSDLGYKDRKCTDIEHQVQCAFCVYMRSGPCRNEFLNWQNCIENVGENEDLVKKCGDITMKLKECTDKYEYYNELHSVNNVPSKTIEEKQLEPPIDEIKK